MKQSCFSKFKMWGEKGLMWEHSSPHSSEVPNLYPWNQICWFALCGFLLSGSWSSVYINAEGIILRQLLCSFSLYSGTIIFNSLIDYWYTIYTYIKEDRLNSFGITGYTHLLFWNCSYLFLWKQEVIRGYGIFFIKSLWWKCPSLGVFLNQKESPWGWRECTVGRALGLVCSLLIPSTPCSPQTSQE